MAGGESIVALSSGAPPSGVAVIRISGPDAGPALRRLAGRLPRPRYLQLTPLRLEGSVLDTALVAWFPAPRSFTGEDCAELHVHGSPAVVRVLLRSLTARPQCRLAEAGEFTRRAFENGKLDLTEVEGLGDLLAAETEKQRKQAVGRLSGGLSLLLEGWRQQLLEARAQIEAQLDFSDEGDVGTLPDGFSTRLQALREDLWAAAESVEGGRIVRDGLRVALAGPPNAGKSSLLNALSKSDLAIVSDEPGTTRDVREIAIDLDGQLVLLLDLAGLRETESRAEAEGVRRAQAAIASSDLVLWLQAPDVRAEAIPEIEGPPTWVVATKTDLGGGPNGSDLAVSARTGDGLAELTRRLALFAEAATGGGEPVLVSRERDRAALAAAASAVAEAEADLERTELAAEALRHAAQALERLLGRMDAEAVLDRLFSSFCIGK